ncbi:MAG: hypothetical protein ACI8Q1_001946 [Parvicella sp.]|jgi:hypothetical protein
MKKIILPILIASFGAISAQNVQDQKINFSYIQLPSTPIEGTENYYIEIDNSLYAAANEDSLSMYEAKLDMAELQMTAWQEQKKTIDKMHLLEMAKWEKATNGGVVALTPVKQPYPEMPKMKSEIPAPILTEDIELSTVDARIALEGFSKSSNGAKITIKFLGLQNAKITETKSGSLATTKYEYKATYKMPAIITIENEGQGIIYNQTLGNSLVTVTAGDKASYASKYEYEYWELEKLDQFWIDAQTKAINSLLASINNSINQECGFPKKQYATEIYTVKSFKSFDYGDLIEGYTKAKQGFDLVRDPEDMSDSKSKLDEAIQIWMAALEESTPSVNKSRINDKVTALLYVNIAEAYLWMNEFDEADTYIQKAKVGGVGKYKREAQDMEAFMKIKKLRYQASN